MSSSKTPYNFPSPRPNILLLRLRPLISQPLHPLWHAFCKYAQEKAKITLATCPYDAMAHMRRASSCGHPYNLIIVADDGIMPHTYMTDKEGLRSRRQDSIEERTDPCRADPSQVVTVEEVVIPNEPADDDEILSQYEADSENEVLVRHLQESPQENIHEVCPSPCGNKIVTEETLKAVGNMQLENHKQPDGKSQIKEQNNMIPKMVRFELEKSQLGTPNPAKPAVVMANPRMEVYDGSWDLRRMLQVAILEGCVVLAAFSFARYADTEKMNSFFQEFGVSWSVGKRRFETELEVNEKYVQVDENGLYTMPRTHQASFTLLQDFAPDESFYTTKDGSLTGLALAPFGKGGLVFIGDDGLMMKYETAQFIVKLCREKAPWFEGKESSYEYKEMKSRAEDLDLALARAIHDHERLSGMLEEIARLKQDASRVIETINRLNQDASGGITQG